MPMQATTTSPLFAATLRPDRSLRLAGGWVGLGAAGIVAAPFLLSVPEFVLPGLAGLSLAFGSLTAIGLRQSGRRKLAQQVTLWPDQLEIASATGGGERQLWRADPKFVRLRLVRDDNERAMALFVRAGDSEIEVGSFLSLADRSSFAREFGRSLRLARLAR